MLIVPNGVARPLEGLFEEREELVTHDASGHHGPKALRLASRSALT